MSATHFTGPVISTNGFINAGNNGDVTMTSGDLTVATGNIAVTAGGVTAPTVAATTSLAVGGGTALTLVKRGTVAIDPASLNDMTAADTSVTVSGAATGDTVVLTPPTAGLTAGLLLCGAWVSASNTVKIRLFNYSGGTINEASGTWTYAIFR